MQPLPPLPSKVFGQGGQSLVYEHQTRPDLLIKLFTDFNHNPLPRVGAEATHIESLNEFQNGITYSHREILSANFSWPVEIYGTRLGVIDGIGILRALDDFWIDIERTTGRSSRQPLDTGFLTTDFLERPVIKSATFTTVSFEDRVEIALEYLYSLQVLWDMGYRFCDYKEQNFLFTLKGRPRVFIIDAESVSPPHESEIRTQGWFPPNHPDYSMESDRSLACLLVWRILGKNPGINPPDRGTDGFLDLLDNRTLKILEDGYRNGTQAHIDDLVGALVRYRSAENTRKAFEWAVNTQLATLVLRYAPPNPSPQEAQILADAREQRVLEDELMALNPRLRQLRKNRSVPRAGFIFDIPDSVVVGAIDRDAEIIRQLALDGEFEEVAEAFKARKSAAPVGQVASRAIQTAIARLGPPPVRTSFSPTREFRVQWSWPGTDVVTGARIRLYLPDGTLSQEGYCDRAKRNPSLTFSARANIPNGSRLVVCYAMHFDDGATVVCPLGTETVMSGLQSTATPPSRSVDTQGGAGTLTDPVFNGEFDTIVRPPIVGGASPLKIDLNEGDGLSGSGAGGTTGGATEIGNPSSGGTTGGATVQPIARGRVRQAIADFGHRVFGRFRR